jgi:phosphatidate cytidylyltransferase
LLKQRVLTAIAILGVLYMGTVWLSPTYFAGFLSLILMPALFEWAGLMGLTRRRDTLLWIGLFTVVLFGLMVLMSLDGSILDARDVAIICVLALVFWLIVFYFLREYPQRQSIWQARWTIGAMGLATLIPTWVGLYYLKVLAPSGALVFILVALVSVVDIGAYFSGRAWGKRKLAPALSPKKSWAGFWGGMAGCGLLTLGLLTWVHLNYQPLSLDLWLLLLAAAMLLAVFSVIGDLFESMLKRHRGIKDSGRSLPGHGGILDRIDSLVAATPIYVLALIMLSADLDVS